MAVHASSSHAQSQSARPASDYQGEFVKFTVANMAEFDNWRLAVESTLTVDFVRGDKHSSRASPRAFKEHVKMVCARHSRSGRKPYEKKHPERQRRVPSRKVGGEGCPAVITYRTFDDRDQVDVEYWPRHSHEIGEANWAFTREGRRQASSHRGAKAGGGGRSHTDEPVDNYARVGTDSTIDWLAPSSNMASTSTSSSAPAQRPTLMTGISATADPNTSYSPYSANSRSPASLSPPQLHRHSPAAFAMYGIPQQHMSLSPAVSPTSNASHTPALSARPLEGTPANLVTGLPTPSRPMQPLPGTPMALQNGTPMLTTHGLPTPSHHGGNLPQASPVSPNYPFPYNMNGYSSAQPSPVQPFSPGLPVSAHHTPAQQQLLLSTHGTPAQPYASLSTPGQHTIDLTTASPANASMLLPTNGSSLHITTTDLQPQMYYDVGLDIDYGPASAGSAHSGMPAVPNDSINLMITGSPSPHPSPLVPDAVQPFGTVDLSVTSEASLPQPTPANLSQSSSSSSGLNDNGIGYNADGIMDLRAERWRKMKNLFDHVHTASHAQHLPEEMVSRLEHTVRQLWNQVQMAQSFGPQPLGMDMNMGMGVGNGSVSLLGPQGHHGHHGHHSHGSTSPHMGSPHLGTSHQHLR